MVPIWIPEPRRKFNRKWLKRSWSQHEEVGGPPISALEVKRAVMFGEIRSGTPIFRGENGVYSILTQVYLKK